MKKKIQIAFRNTTEITYSNHTHRTSNGWEYTQYFKNYWDGPYVSVENIILSMDDTKKVLDVIHNNYPKNEESSYPAYWQEEDSAGTSFSGEGIAQKINNILDDNYPFEFEDSTQKLEVSLNGLLLRNQPQYVMSFEQRNKEIEQLIDQNKKNFIINSIAFYYNNYKELLRDSLISTDCLLPNLNLYLIDVVAKNKDFKAVLELAQDKHCQIKETTDLLDLFFSYDYNFLYYLLECSSNKERNDLFGISDCQYQVLRRLLWTCLFNCKQNNRYIILKYLKNFVSKGLFALFDLLIKVCGKDMERNDVYEVLAFGAVRYGRIDLLEKIKTVCPASLDRIFFNQYPYQLSVSEYVEVIRIINENDMIKHIFSTVIPRTCFGARIDYVLTNKESLKF